MIPKEIQEAVDNLINACLLYNEAVRAGDTSYREPEMWRYKANLNTLLIGLLTDAYVPILEWRDKTTENLYNDGEFNLYHDDIIVGAVYQMGEDNPTFIINKGYGYVGETKFDTLGEAKITCKDEYLARKMKGFNEVVIKLK